MRKLVIATRNKGKVKEIVSILGDLDLDICDLGDYPGFEDPAENTDTFAGNAAVKAIMAAEHTGEMCLADDSGLVVDALGGRPGVYSSRYAGESASDEDRIRKLLEEMADVPDDNRSAHFAAAVAIAVPGRLVAVVEGKCCGAIARSPRGENGFGYDPVFIPDGMTNTMAEIPPEVKNKISHRARALRLARRVIIGQICEDWTVFENGE